MTGPAAKRRALATAALRGLFVLALAAGGALWAQQLSKEYIHAGERLLAVKVPSSMPVGGALTASLTADPVLVTAGDEVTLRWETTGALSATLTQDGGQDAGTVTPLEGGSHTVTPSADTTYTLSVTGEAGTITINPGITASLTADPFLLATGETSTLRWATTGATSATLSQDVGAGIGEVSETDLASGSEDVTPTATTTYTLTASGDSGTATATATISVGPSATLTANPDTIEAGETSTLSWTTTDATSATLNPGNLTIPATELAMGDEDVTPDETTTYELAARNVDGILAIATATVTVGDPGPGVITIDLFSVDDATPAYGDDVVFTWETTGATRVRLQQFISNAWSDIGGDRAADGDAMVSPPSTPQSLGYRIVAHSADDSEASDSIPVTWPVQPDPNDPIIDFFTSSDNDTTPLVITKGEPTRLSWATTRADTVTLETTVSGTTTPESVNVDGFKDVTPTTSPTTYELTATNTDGRDADSLEIEVVDPPVIDTFAADDSDLLITAGDEVMLSWTTTDATEVSISNTSISGSTSVDSSTTVTPTTTTTYTLTAANKDGTEVTDSLEIEVVEPPMIVSFSGPQRVTKGAMADLSWETKNATSASIDQGIGTLTQVASGSYRVTITANITFTLTAENDDGQQDTATHSITAVEAPEIISFTASPNPIGSGTTTTLSWETQNATDVSLAQNIGTNIGSVGATGSRQVSPPATSTIYSLTAKNNADTPSLASTSVTVNFSPTATLSANPTYILHPGDPVTLTWNTTHATSASIDQGVGTVSLPGGSDTVNPDDEITYELTATGPGGTARAYATVVRILQRGLLQVTLTADPTTITAGGSTTLSWTTTNATSATLTQDVGDDIGAVSLGSGTRQVSPAVTTVYTLTGSRGEGEDAVSALATVTVNVKEP